MGVHQVPKELKLLWAEKEQKDPTITPLQLTDILLLLGWILYFLCVPVCGLHTAPTPWILSLVMSFSSWSDAHPVGTEDLHSIACISAGSLPLTSLCHEDTRSPGRTAPSSFFLDGSPPTVTSIFEIAFKIGGQGYLLLLLMQQNWITQIFLPLLPLSHKKILCSSKTCTITCTKHNTKSCCFYNSFFYLKLSQCLCIN